MKKKEFFNSKFDGSPNYEIVVIGEKLKVKNKVFSVLDLGCGDGRNSFYLSGLNCIIDAVDLDSKNLERLNYISRFYGRKINIHCENVMNFKFKRNYDLIISHGLLHFLEANQTEDLVNKIILNTTNGGVNIFTTAYYSPDDVAPLSLIKSGHKNQYTAKKLEKLYGNWNVLVNEDYFKWDYHHSFGAHGHRIQKLIAQKKECDIKIEKLTFNLYEIIHKNNNDLVKFLRQQRSEALSKEDIWKTIEYFVDGPQFSFGNFSTGDLTIEFDFVQNLLFQSNNNVISGITELYNNFTMIK